MNPEYKYTKRHLDKKIVRHILENELPLSMYGLSAAEVQERVVKYHEKRGGKPAKIKDTYGPVYGVLQELVKAGKFKDRKADKIRYFRSVEIGHTADIYNLQDFLGVVTEECRILHNHIETLKQQVEMLEKRKSELQTILDKDETP